MSALVSPESIVQQAPSFVRVGASELALRRVGQGPPLVFVHGYPLGGLTFRALAARLAPDFTCHLVDLPGGGESRWTSDTDFGFRGQVKTLAGLVESLGLGPVVMVAHDTGATIARKLAADRPDLVRSLLVIGTEIPGHRPPWIPLFQRISHPDRTGLLRALLARRWFRRSSAAFGGCFWDLDRIDGEFFRLFVAPLLESEARARGQIHFLRGIDWEVVDGLAEDHRRIRAPTLLVWGEQDTVFPPALARRMTEQLPSSLGFVVIPRARLFVHEERPDAVLEAARPLLARSLSA